jgi:hypothetical protein
MMADGTLSVAVPRTRGASLRNAWRAILLAIVSLTVAVAMAEGLARLAGVATAGFTDPIFHKSAAPGVSYELAANARGYTWGHTWVEANEFGMRSPAVALKKPAGTLRVAVFGDSVTFGQGVLDEETYPRVLERQLRERRGASGRRVEVLNFALPAYNISNIVSSFVEKGVAFDLDVAILAPIVEDFGLHRNHSVDEAGYPHHAASPLGAGWLKNLLRRIHLSYLIRDVWWGLTGTSTHEVQAVYGTEEGPLSEATWSRARAEIDRFARVARERGIRPVYLALDLGKSRTLDGIVAASGLERVEVRQALEGYDPEALRVSARDGHPSALQHRLIAAVVLRALGDTP